MRMAASRALPLMTLALPKTVLPRTPLSVAWSCTPSAPSSRRGATATWPSSCSRSLTCARTASRRRTAWASRSSGRWTRRSTGRAWSCTASGGLSTRTSMGARSSTTWMRGRPWCPLGSWWAWTTLTRT
uniref:Uncharacterized protein n=1 Tax=Ixodes ricinus TaxID=34613 RepID=A0A6B0UR92_IXORI